MCIRLQKGSPFEARIRELVTESLWGDWIIRIERTDEVRPLLKRN